jgi:hypothetical protein
MEANEPATLRTVLDAHATKPPVTTTKLRAALAAAAALAVKQEEARRTMAELQLALARQITMAEATGPLSVMDYPEAVNKVLASAGSRERLHLQR